MNDKKYYWMKTKQDFYDRDEIRYIENMKNGDTIIKLYQKLCLTSLNKDGKLIFQLGSKIIPYTEEQLGIELGGLEPNTLVSKGRPFPGGRTTLPLVR